MLLPRKLFFLTVELLLLNPPLSTVVFEALNLFLAEQDNSTLIFPSPKSVTGKNIVPVSVDAGVAFAMNLRQTRLKLNKTQNQMMELLGIKTLSNYQRLEDPKRANPELKTLAMILKAVPQIEIGTIIGNRVQTSKKKVSWAIRIFVLNLFSRSCMRGKGE